MTLTVLAGPEQGTCSGFCRRPMDLATPHVLRPAASRFPCLVFLSRILPASCTIKVGAKVGRSRVAIALQRARHHPTFAKGGGDCYLFSFYSSQDHDGILAERHWSIESRCRSGVLTQTGRPDRQVDFTFTWLLIPALLIHHPLSHCGTADKGQSAHHQSASEQPLLRFSDHVGRRLKSL